MKVFQQKTMLNKFVQQPRMFATMAFNVKSKFEAAYESKMAATAKVPQKM